MKMKDMFKKMETYNEVAEVMMVTKAKIQFGEKWHSERFDNFNDFKKYIRNEYIKEVADKILNFEGWEIDGESTIEGNWGESTFFSEIVSN